MPKRPDAGRFTPQISPGERLEQRKAAQQRLQQGFRQNNAARVAEQKAAEEERAARPVRDVTRLTATLNDIPLYQLAQPEPQRPSALYRELQSIALRTINAQSREAVLCWPNCDPSPAAIAAFLVLTDCASAALQTVDGLDALSPPLGVRALIYPYARTAHRALRHLYVDKEYLSRIHTRHQIRDRTPGEDAALSDYHKTLARSRSLTGRDRLGAEHDEFKHPCLDETLPSGPCSGAEGRSELLERVRKKTDLARGISRNGKADDPATARFYLFGVRAGEAGLTTLKRFKGPLDLVLLDLDYTGRSRIGRDWVRRTRDFLAELTARVGPVATVALTDDPWSLDRLRYDVLGTPAKRKTPARPADSGVVFAPASDIIESEAKPPTAYTAVQKWDVLGFAGEVEAVLARLSAAQRRATDKNDAVAAEHMRNLSGALRRCACLPGSLSQLNDYVSSETGPLAAADLLTAYRVGGIVRELQASHGPYAQLHRADLTALCDDVTEVAGKASRLTPMAPLLRDVVRRFLRVSSRTVLLFPNDMLADFAAHALREDEEIGQTVDDRTENGMLMFTYRAGFEDLASLPGQRRNYTKTLIVVAPPRSAMLTLLASPWLPDTVIVLADSNTLAGAARDAARLAAYPELSVLNARMAAFSQRAAETYRQVTNSAVSFDPGAGGEGDLDFPVSSVVNLAGNVRGNQTVIRFDLDGGQVILARPGTKLVIQDKSRTIPIFAEVDACDVDVGERVCVIGDAFLEMARPMLNITARAAEEIRDYHNIVLQRFARLQGETTAARLETLVGKMALASVTTARAGYWIDLDEQLSAPLHEVVPHAPRDQPTFMAFMKALDVDEGVARRFWIWAVIAQRTSRVRAAMSFHDAYRGILMDSYAAQSDNPDRARDVRLVRAAAGNFIGVVERKREQRGDDARA